MDTKHINIQKLWDLLFGYSLKWLVSNTNRYFGHINDFIRYGNILTNFSSEKVSIECMEIGLLDHFAIGVILGNVVPKAEVVS